MVMSTLKWVISGLVVAGTVLAVSVYHPRPDVACPNRVIDQQGWKTLPLPYGPFVIRVPNEARRDPGFIGWSSITGTKWLLEVGVATVDGVSSVSEDKALNLIPHTLANEFSLPLPPSIVAIGASYCTDTLAGRPMRVRLYHSERYWNGPFIADAVWPVAKGSWLTFVIASQSAAARDMMLATLHSLRVDTSATMLALVHPSAACPSWPEVPSTPLSQRQYVGPVAFKTPANLIPSPGPGFSTAAWQLPDGSGLRFNILRTPGWQLPTVVDTSFQGVWLWCQMNIHGHLAEVLVDTTARSPDVHFAQMYDINAFMRMAPDSILLIQGGTDLFKSDAARQGAIRELFQILESARVSNHH